MRTAKQIVRRRAGSVSPLSPYAFLCSMSVLVVLGCTNNETSSSHQDITLTASAERSQRRAYDGAPPVIPHPRLGASCIECHTATGKEVPQRGFAPANPHVHTAGLSEVANCRQCHMFQQTDDLFAQSEFIGLAQTFAGGDRLYPTAPPVIPHRVFMRENCLACHDGPVARPEIRCSHPQRANCRQCHVAHDSKAIWPAGDLPSIQKESVSVDRQEGCSNRSVVQR